MRIILNFNRQEHRLMRLPLASALLVLAIAPAARANDRHFTFTYESAVLPQGGRELEVWTTPRLGRDDYFARFDHRVEFEVGLTGRLMTSLYLNFSGTTQASTTVPGQLDSMVEFQGVSSEWKLKLLDPVANAVGLALYGEVTASPSFGEFEGKVILDKYVGPVLLAANLVGAWEMPWKEMPGVESELELELDLAAAYFVTPNVALGLELRSHTELEEAETVESSALFLGPVVAYATKGWWVAFTVMPQLPALKKYEGTTGPLELHSHEVLNARLLFSFHL
jgi:hypothetical protein